MSRNKDDKQGRETQPGSVCSACNGSGTFTFRDGRRVPCTNCHGTGHMACGGSR